MKLKIKAEHCILSMIVIIAFVLRIYHLGYESVWLDEVTSLLISQNRILSMLEITKGDVHPPLYYIILHFFTLIGDTEFIIRLPSMIFGVLSTLAIFQVGKLNFDVKTGLFSAFLLSISIVHIYYSQEARMYSMVLFFSLICVYYFTKIIQDNERQDWIGLTIFTILNTYTHYYTIFLTIPIIVSYVWIIALNCRTLRIKTLYGFIGYILALFISFLPSIFIFINQALGRVSGTPAWGLNPTIDFYQKLTVSFSNGDQTTLFYYFFFVIGLLTLFAYDHSKNQSIFFTLWWITPIVASFLLSSRMPFQYRYLIFILPAFLLLVSKGVVWVGDYTSTLYNRKLFDKIELSVIVILICMLMFSATSASELNKYYTIDQKSDWRDISIYLQNKTNDGDIIVPLPNYIQKSLAYYYDNSSDNTSIINVQYSSNALNNITNNSEVDVWFIFTQDINAADPEKNALRWLAKNSVFEHINGEIQIFKYATGFKSEHI